MARTGGTRKLPLPASVAYGLERLGLVPFTPAGADSKGAHHYMLPSRPAFTVTLTASRIPGESAVIAQWEGQAPDRYEPDALLRLLQFRVDQAQSPTQRAADILDQMGIGVPLDYRVGA